MIARAASAQDEATGDGTTSNVLIIGELLKQAQMLVAENLHPRVVTDGFEVAKVEALKFLDSFRRSPEKVDRDLLVQVARTSLRTKVRVFSDDAVDG